MSEKAKTLILKWDVDAGVFNPVGSDDEMDNGIFLELDSEQEQWKYFYIEGASLIQRRTALRSANGISKTGYVHPESGIRYGVEYKLFEEKSPYEDMPDKLRQAQRTWYQKK
ncbi:MAG: hypothetical protein GF364_07610 [Candidatus Lokiarchaeota archaeon]|nr:hypothetical protein [Candidatus Lokiarchaeota archaeon]